MFTFGSILSAPTAVVRLARMSLGTCLHSEARSVTETGDCKSQVPGGDGDDDGGGETGG